MTVRGLGWMDVRTAAAGDMARLYRDVLGLDVVHQSADAMWFRTADGTPIHVYPEDDKDHRFFGLGPVVGFRVDRFEPVRAALAAAGISFLYPRPQRDAGIAWQHFRAPDGNVYEIIGPDHGIHRRSA